MFDRYPDPRGRYLGRVAMEIDRIPSPEVVGDRALGVVRDDLDVVYVVVYRLEGRG